MSRRLRAVFNISRRRDMLGSSAVPHLSCSVGFNNITNPYPVGSCSMGSTGVFSDRAESDDATDAASPS